MAQVGTAAQDPLSRMASAPQSEELPQHDEQQHEPPGRRRKVLSRVSYKCKKREFQHAAAEKGADAEKTRRRGTSLLGVQQVAQANDMAGRDPAMTEMRRFVAALSEQLSQQSELLTKQSAELAGMQAKSAVRRHVRLEAHEETVSRMDSNFKSSVDSMSSVDGSAANHVEDVAAAAMGAGERFDTEHDSADVLDLTNLYSFALINLEHLLALPTLKPRHCLRIVTMCMAPVVLTFIQLFFAYGFYDASIVLKVQGTLGSFRDPLPFSFWYAESVVPGTHAVLLNVILSICALILLAVYLKSDNEGTMVTGCPLELLCLPRAGGGAPLVRLKRSPGRRRRALRLHACIHIC